MNLEFERKTEEGTWSSAIRIFNEGKDEVYIVDPPEYINGTTPYNSHQEVVKAVIDKFNHLQERGYYLNRAEFGYNDGVGLDSIQQILSQTKETIGMLTIVDNQLPDLSFLKVPVKYLIIKVEANTDLAPLAGISPEWLNLTIPSANNFHIPVIPQLKNLILKVTDTGSTLLMDFVKQLPILESLSITRVAIDDFDVLAEMKNLKQLSFSEITTSVKKFEFLKELNLLEEFGCSFSDPKIKVDMQGLGNRSYFKDLVLYKGIDSLDFISSIKHFDRLSICSGFEFTPAETENIGKISSISMIGIEADCPKADFSPWKDIRVDLIRFWSKKIPADLTGLLSIQHLKELEIPKQKDYKITGSLDQLNRSVKIRVGEQATTTIKLAQKLNPDLPKIEMSKDWMNLEKYFEKNMPDVMGGLNMGASEQELKEFEKLLGKELPADFRNFYLAYNGQGEDPDTSFVLGHNISSLQNIISDREIWLNMIKENGQGTTEPGKGVQKDTWYDPLWIPFTSDFHGNHYLVDLNPAAGGSIGQIIYMNHESGKRPVIAKSLDDLWKKLLAKAKKGEDILYLEFIL